MRAEKIVVLFIVECVLNACTVFLSAFEISSLVFFGYCVHTTSNKRNLKECTVLLMHCSCTSSGGMRTIFFISLKGRIKSPFQLVKFLITLRIQLLAFLTISFQMSGLSSINICLSFFV